MSASFPTGPRGLPPTDVENDPAPRVREATAAARNAYRDTARLIRLLSVLSDPSAPDELLDRALTVLSEVFTADIVCVAWVVDRRGFVVRSRGLPEDDLSWMDGWVLRRI